MCFKILYRLIILPLYLTIIQHILDQKTKLFLQQMLGLNNPDQQNDQEDFQRKSSTELLRSMNITIGVSINILAQNF